MKFQLLFYFLFTFVFDINNISLKPAHNFYLSISEIVYKKDNQTFEISIRFFSDDLEKAILNATNTEIFDKEGNIIPASSKDIYNYLKKHFFIYDNRGKIIECDFIGWETENDISWCYLEAHHRKFEYLKVTNNLLIEMFFSRRLKWARLIA